jgi:hypothetical protein
VLTARAGVLTMKDLPLVHLLNPLELKAASGYRKR